MSELKTRFETAAQEVQQLAKRPGNDVLLKLYALYKQATEGDVNGARPGLFPMDARLKYDARAKIKGTNQNDAMQQYIDLVESLKVKDSA
ncbi:MAG: acyl-CoA-binding protein [Oscillochloris sp.]|nr:acyl-CoA-binding protein [Oscillochloris sp.]